MICCSYSSRENVSHNSNSHNSNTSTNCTISYLSRVRINLVCIHCLYSQELSFCSQCLKMAIQGLLTTALLKIKIRNLN